MEANSFRTLPKAGANGDACSFTSQIELDALAIAGRVEWAKLPPGTELQEVILINDALGASTTLTIGELFDSTADGTTDADSLMAATASSTAGRIQSAFQPRTYQVPVTITSTVGGAAATGTVTAIIKYRYIGTA
jgi:hypothetical protein